MIRRDRSPGQALVSVFVLFAVLVPVAIPSTVAAQSPGTEPLAEVIRRLYEGEAETRCRAAEDLWRRGEEAWPAVPDLAEALRDRDVAVRRMAALALAGIGPKAEVALPALARALEDEDDEVRRRACRALWRLGPRNRPAAGDLVRCLDGDDPVLLAEALQALHYAGPAARFAERRLVEMTVLARPAELRPLAEHALRGLWPPGEERDRRVETLVEEIASPEAETRGPAGRLLEVLGTEALERARPILGAKPGVLEIGADGVPDHAVPGSSASLQIRAKNLSAHGFWIPYDAMRIRGRTSGFDPLVRELVWGRSNSIFRRRSAGFGDGRGPLFALSRFLFLAAGDAVDLGGGGFDFPDTPGRFSCTFSVRAPAGLEAPLGIETWRGERTIDLQVFVLPERWWREESAQDSGLAATLETPSKVPAGEAVKAFLTLTNRGDRPLLVPAPGPPALAGVWILIAPADADRVERLRGVLETGDPVTLDPEQDGRVLAPGASSSWPILFHAPPTPGRWRVRAGFGPYANPDGLSREGAAAFAGELRTGFSILKAE